MRGVRNRALFVLEVWERAGESVLSLCPYRGMVAGSLQSLQNLCARRPWVLNTASSARRRPSPRRAWPSASTLSARGQVAALPVSGKCPIRAASGLSCDSQRASLPSRQDRASDRDYLSGSLSLSMEPSLRIWAVLTHSRARREQTTEYPRCPSQRMRKTHPVRSLLLSCYSNKLRRACQQGHSYSQLLTSSSPGCVGGAHPLQFWCCMY